MNKKCRGKCGLYKPNNKSHFYVNRRWLKNGLTSETFASTCIECTRVTERERARKKASQTTDQRRESQKGYRLREMKCIPEVELFLYGRIISAHG